MAQAINAPRRINVISSSLPSWIPPAGQVGLVPMLNTFLDVDPCPADNCSWNSTYNGSGSIGVMTSESGGIHAPHFSQYGALLLNGGGHRDNADNATYALNITNSGGEWIALDLPTDDPSLAQSVPIVGDGEYIDGQPGSHHSYQNLIVLPPGVGGAGSKGALITPVRSALAGDNSPSFGKSHIFQLDQPIPAVTRWTRFGPWTTAANSPNATSMCCYDSSRNGIWQTFHGGTATISFLNLSTGDWTNYGGLTSSTGGMTTNSNMMFYIPSRDIIVGLWVSGTAPNPARMRWLQPGFPPIGWTNINTSGDGLPLDVSVTATNRVGADYCPDNGKLYWIVKRHPDRIYEITIPAVLSDPWPVSIITHQGPAAAVTAWNKIGSRAHGPFQRFSYFPSLKCFIYPWAARGEPQAGAPSGVSISELVLSFKPSGT